MKINNITVVPRFNRPSVLGKTALEFHYIRNGAYADPYAVCSVHVFQDQMASSVALSAVTNGDPSVFLDLRASGDTSQYGMIASGNLSGAVAVFQGSGVGNASASFNEAGFGGTVTTASGIYKLGAGRYGVAIVPGAYYISSTGTGGYDVHGPGASSVYAGSGIQAVSGAGNYFDVWTIKDNETSRVRTYIHKFIMYNDVIISTTEPLLVTPVVSLVQKYVEYGSKINLKFPVDITLENGPVPASIRNVFRQNVIQSASVNIRYFDDNSGSFVNDGTKGSTNSFVDATRVMSDDLVTYSWDTSVSAVAGGRYESQIRFTLLDETIYSDKFNLVVR